MIALDLPHTYESRICMHGNCLQQEWFLQCHIPNFNVMLSDEVYKVLLENYIWTETDYNDFRFDRL